MSRVLLDAVALGRVIGRMAHEIAESNPDTTSLCLVGLQRGGVALARRISGILSGIVGHPIQVGVLDVSLYRDDLDQRVAPEIRPTDVPFDPSQRDIVLVDDVLFTGRTTRAALDALSDLGRPRRIQLAVLVDRGHRELPIRADFTGKAVTTTLHQTIKVRLREDGGDDTVCLEDLES
jgi:pyrimidine operon attenuation protein/uracil phosphoribosyltransferase